MPAKGNGRWPGNDTEFLSFDAAERGGAVAALVADYFFGDSVESAIGTAEGDSLALATGWVAPWHDGGAAGYTLGPASRSTAVFALPATDDLAVSLSLEDSADGAGVLLTTVEDGRNGYWCRVEESGGNRLLRLSRVVEAQVVDEGGGVFVVATAASDIPASSTAEVDVSAIIATATPYRLEVRTAAGVIEARLNDEATPYLRYALATAVNTPVTGPTFNPKPYGTFPDFKAAGFVAAVAGARVLSADLYALVGQISGRADVPVWVCGGNVYACVDGVTPLTVGVGVFPAGVMVDMDAFNGLMLIVGGGKAVEFSPVTLRVSNWIPTAGSLPGSTGAGTTTAKIVSAVGTRITLGDITGDEQNVIYSATGDHRDLDTGSDAPGAAYALSGYQAAKVGHPVVATAQTSNAGLMVFTTQDIYLVVGDPAVGDLPRAIVKGSNVQVSGKDAAWLTDEGLVVAHSLQGVLVGSVDGVMKNVTREVLSTGIQFDTRPTVLIPIIVPDPRHTGFHLFLNNGEGSLHFWWDTAWNKPGGFHPERYPWAPRAATLWKNVPIILCADGYIRRFTDEAEDDDGTPIESYTTLPQLSAGVNGMEAEIGRIEMVMGIGSAPVVLSIIRARTSEEAYRGIDTDTAVEESIEETCPTPLIYTVRAPSLLVRLASAAGRWALEALEAAVSMGNIRTWR